MPPVCSVEMSRPARIITFAAIAIAFIGLSLGLGRVLAARGAERTLLERLIADQAAGRVGAVADAIEGCRGEPACEQRVARLVGKVSSPGGNLEVLQITQGTGVSPGASTGVARIAWNAGTELPVVQCVATRRAGNVVGGFRVTIVAVSSPIDRTGACPAAGELAAQVKRGA